MYTIIVYKNKSDGSRAIRYQGLDEAYAVNEIYLKLQVEMQKQEARKIAQMQSSAQSRSDYSNRTSNSDYSNRTNNSNYHETTSSSRSSRSSGNKLKKRIILTYQYNDSEEQTEVYYDVLPWDSLKAQYNEKNLYPTKKDLLESL